MREAESSVTDAVITSVRIGASVEAVFDHLVDPEKLVRWMGVEVDIDPRPGGRFWMNVTGQDKASGQYVTVDRPHRVAFTWGWEGNDGVPPGSSTVSIQLTQDGAETVVELTHSGLPMGADDGHLEGWLHYLPRLQVAATGGDPGPDPNHRPT